jgi:hypothetical protein
MTSTPTSGAPPRTGGAGVIDIDDDLLGRVLRHPAGAAGWLLQHRSGLLHSQLTEALARVLLACHDTGKPGEIQLRIRIRPNPDCAGQMVISDQIVARPPEQATSLAYLFDADALRLQGEEPGQLSIPLTA